MTSPYHDRSTSFALLGEGFGQSPFIVREISVNGNIPVPYLIAASAQSVKAVHLLSGEVVDIFEAGNGERIFASFVERYVTLELNGQNIYFLKESDGVTVLREQPIFAGEGRDIPLDDGEVAGPITVGEKIFLYSKKTLFVLDGGQIQSHTISESFNPWVAPTEAESLHPHFGRMPVLVQGESAYIPGSRGRNFGFLVVTLQRKSINSAFLPCDGDISYTQDLEGRLLVASTGQITVYDHTSPRVVRRDRQLSFQEVPYHSENLTVGSTTTASNVYSLRFYCDKDVRDYSLAALPDFVEVAGFSQIASTFALLYLDEQSHLGMRVWDA